MGLQQEESAAFLASVYDQYFKKLKGYAYNQLAADGFSQNLTDISEEIIQTVFSMLARHVDTLKGLQEAQIKAYLFKATKHTLIRYIQIQRRQPVIVDVGDITNDLADSKQPEIRYLEREMIGAAMEQLNERDKAVITLHYFVGLSHAEIGDILGITENNAGVVLYRAIQKLKRYMVQGEAANGATETRQTDG